MSERRGYRITGVVQGVGFRWWTRNLACTLDLRGTVRNAADGSVRIRVEGDGAGLDRFEDALASGPSGAEVRAVERQEPGEEDLPAGFDSIR